MMAPNPDPMNQPSTSFGHAHAVALHHPDKIAMRFEPSGRKLSFGQLESASNQHAHALRAAGLKAGDAVALCYPNAPELLILIGAAARLGLYYTLLPYRASAQDMAYIIDNSQAKLALVATSAPALAELPALLDADRVALFAHALSGADGVPKGLADWQTQVQSQPDTLPDAPVAGREMLYSSGSTGRPKGIRRALPAGAWNSPDMRNVAVARALDLTPASVYLSTSPLYHSAPNRYLQSALSAGALSIVMEHFDAEAALELIDRHRCTHSVWVPTMFQRMLRLEPEIRARWSSASMAHAAHGAAPCPMHVKQAMIDWWGPILDEYYAGTEGLGSTWITSAEWLLHKGSVGRPRDCRVHILDEQGVEQPADTTGTVYFESSVGEFSYWNDPQKTQAVLSPQGWRTFGDIGHVDADGYLYLTDRRDFMVISGGVNLYPQEIEHAMLEHPAVVDVAAFGVPDDDLGEKLVAVVQLDPTHSPTSALLDDLQTFCQTRLGRIKAPKQIAVMAQLPRLETGKLHKKRLQADWLKGTLSSSAPA